VYAAIELLLHMLVGSTAAQPAGFAAGIDAVLVLLSATRERLTRQTAGSSSPEAQVISTSLAFFLFVRYVHFADDDVVVAHIVRITHHLNFK
jgi:hypothetical protein